MAKFSLVKCGEASLFLINLKWLLPQTQQVGILSFMSEVKWFGEFFIENPFSGFVGIDQNKRHTGTSGTLSVGIIAIAHVKALLRQAVQQLAYGIQVGFTGFKLMEWRRSRTELAVRRELQGVHFGFHRVIGIDNAFNTAGVQGVQKELGIWVACGSEQFSYNFV